jgi:hypothetical protein
MAPSLLAECGMDIGADCSMRLGLGRYTAQQRTHIEEGGQADLRGLGEAHADASLPLRHPLWDEDEPAGGRDAHEGSVARGRVMAPRHRERLAAARMPWVVDGDRS